MQACTATSVATASAPFQATLPSKGTCAHTRVRDGSFVPSSLFTVSAAVIKCEHVGVRHMHTLRRRRETAVFILVYGLISWGYWL